MIKMKKVSWSWRWNVLVRTGDETMELCLTPLAMQSEGFEYRNHYNTWFLKCKITYACKSCCPHIHCKCNTFFTVYISRYDLSGGWTVTTYWIQILGCFVIKFQGMSSPMLDILNSDITGSFRHQASGHVFRTYWIQILRLRHTEFR
jgi:hypothetical protein